MPAADLRVARRYAGALFQVARERNEVDEVGRSLAEVWDGVPKAYLGITVPDFPNFFILNGPNTNAGHGGSAVIATEFQMRYVMQALAQGWLVGSTPRPRGSAAARASPRFLPRDRTRIKPLGPSGG